MDKVHSPNFLQGRCGPTQPAPEVPFFSKRKEPKIRQRGSVLFGIFSKGKTAPLLSVLPYFFVCSPENGQSPFSELFCRKVTPPRELRLAKFSPPDCSASRRMSGFASAASGSGSLRRCSDFLGSGVSKGVMLDPFSWRSRNQVVPCAPFVHFLATGNGPQGAGAGSHPANRSCRDFPANNTAWRSRSSSNLRQSQSAPAAPRSRSE